MTKLTRRSLFSMLLAPIAAKLWPKADYFAGLRGIKPAPLGFAIVEINPDLFGPDHPENQALFRDDCALLLAQATTSIEAIHSGNCLAYAMWTRQQI